MHLKILAKGVKKTTTSYIILFILISDYKFIIKRESITMNKLILALSATVLLASPAFAGDAAAGKGKAAMCSACHGADGISPFPTYPNLAGQHAAYLNKQLNDFKSGARNDPMMKGMVASLSEADMADLAAYYASLK